MVLPGLPRNLLSGRVAPEAIELPSDPAVTENLCNRCNLCVKNCAGRALDEEGKTDQMKYLAHS